MENIKSSIDKLGLKERWVGRWKKYLWWSKGTVKKEMNGRVRYFQDLPIAQVTTVNFVPWQRVKVVK